MDINSILFQGNTLEELSTKFQEDKGKSLYRNINTSSTALSDELANIIENNASDSQKPVEVSPKLESIILEFKRPAFLIQNNSYQVNQNSEWVTKLDKAREFIETFIPSVGVIEMKNYPSGRIFSGTAWLIREDILITNRHVANDFSYAQDGQYSFKLGRRKKSMKALIDFREEFDVNREIEFKIESILHIEPEGQADLAFLKVKNISDNSDELPTPIDLSTDISIDQEIVAIGYPTYDTNSGVSIETMERIFENKFGVKRLLPGIVKHVDQENLHHDCSTLIGSSGSVLLDLSTGNAIGIHFSGSAVDGQFNEAVTSNKILDVMQAQNLN